jgi:GTPase SAR1 family protein
MQTKKIVIVGPAQIGKSHLVSLLTNQKQQVNFFGQPIPNNVYVPTLGVEVVPLYYQNVCYNLWDCSGNPQFSGLGSGYYVEADGLLCLRELGTIDNTTSNKVVDFQIKNPGKQIVTVWINPQGQNAINVVNGDLCYSNVNQIPINILESF